MGENLFFLFAFAALLSGLIFVRKSEQPKPLLPVILGSFLTELCIGTVAAKVCALLSVAVGLKSIGVAYLIVGICIWTYMVVSKQFQKFRVDSWNVYSFSVITIWYVILFLSIFTIGLSNKYINSDPAVHLNFALNVMDTGRITNMPFGELFNGLILSMFRPFVARISLYKVYILADAAANFVNVLMFYVLVAAFCKHKFVKAILPFLCLGYFFGWPLFSYILGGFGYLSWGGILSAYIVYLLMQFYGSGTKREQVILLIEIGLSYIGLAFCYMLFLPILGILILLTLILKIKKDSSFVISAKKMVIGGLVMAGIGAVLVVISFKGYFYGSAEHFFDVLSTDGWTHKDLYRDFVFLMPPCLYMGWHYIKTRKINFAFLSSVSTLAFAAVTFVLCLCEIVSSYYFYKIYYILWIFLWLMLIDAMDYFMEKDKGIIAAYGITFCIPFIMTLSGFDYMLEDKGIVVNEKHSSFYPSLYPILDGYAYYLSEEDNWLDDKEALNDISGFILDNFTEETEIPLICCDGRWGYWYHAFTGRDSVYVANSNELLDALSGYIREGHEYIVIHQNYETYRKVAAELEGYERTYDNGYYGLYHISQ